ncbi:hypothetical protein [Pseudogulbenkiania sp. MAI-1]|uniref:hypothetical protein n=1 Tax=Pseudogulbenkiania sp. MAI-1 TaxID=990370 RepID=UPI001E3E913A|nr:hypothetical protein [Pseudogulbenkiania sp. MAI-1]
MAIVSKAALPTLENVALWLPLLYPYGWMAVSGLLWSVSTVRLGRVRSDAPDRQAVLAAYFHAQLALHVGVVLLLLSMPWQAWWLYLFFPPVMAGIGYLWYLAMLWHQRQRGQDAFLRRCSAVLAWLVPLSVLAVTARLTPLLLTLF